MLNQKLSVLDRFIGYFAPGVLATRLRSRAVNDLLLRQYDAAQSNPSLKRNANSANVEIKNALAPIRYNARELVRNVPFAKKGVEIITNGIVGWGIEVSISHDDKKIEAQLKKEFLAWSTSGCSTDPFMDFYTIQRHFVDALVGDGETLLRKVITGGSVRYQILEADYIATNFSKKTEDDGSRWVNGILMDKYFRPLKFAIYTKHPSEITTSKGEVEIVDASEIIHIFDPARPQQNRGISWLAPVISALQTLAEIQWTQLMKMKLSASITAVVTSPASQLTPDALKKQREDTFALEAGSVIYAGEGETYNFPTVPNTEGFGETTKLSLREIACGLGITYEALSGDLSQVNFSSGRLGDLQFRANVDRWRWHVVIPKGVARMMEGFKEYCRIKGIKVDGAHFEYVPPARQMINPTEEIQATKNAIRAGLQTLPNAIRELGFDPKTHISQIAESNQMLDDHGVILDSDPRRTGNEQLQAGDSLKSIKEDQKSK